MKYIKTFESKSNYDFLLTIQNMEKSEIYDYIKDHMQGFGYDEEDIGKDEYEMFFKLKNKMNKLKKSLDLYRILYLPNIEYFKHKQIGHHFVLDYKIFSDDEFRASVDIPEYNDNLYIVHVKVDKDEIDFENTILQNLAYPHEKEILLHNENPSNFISIKPYSEYFPEDSVNENLESDTILYHLTTYDRYIDIMKNGLDPKYSQQSKIQGGGIYFSDDLYTAKNYQGFYDLGKRLAIIKVKLSDLDEKYIKPDDYELQDYIRSSDNPNRNWYDITWQDSLKLCNQIQYTKKINPRYIELESQFTN